MKLTVTRERRFGRTAKQFHYVARLGSEPIATSDTKAGATETAMRALLDAHKYSQSRIYASVAVDGTIYTTREYSAGLVEHQPHRGDSGSYAGLTMAALQIDGKRVSAREFHEHYVAAYNAAVTPTEVLPLTA
jgi:hypothetical protein